MPIYGNFEYECNKSHSTDEKRTGTALKRNDSIVVVVVVMYFLPSRKPFTLRMYVEASESHLN